MKGKEPERRKFLKNGVVLASIAVGAVRPAGAQAVEQEKAEMLPGGIRLYGDRSHFEKAGRSEAHTPFQDSVGIITPSALHFVNNHGNVVPDIDPAQHRLMIHGMVEHPLVLSLEDLKRLPSVSRIHFVECAGNSAPSELGKGETVQETHGFMSCSEWTGVLLSLLLKEAGMQKGASWIVAEGADANKHSKSIPLEKALDDCFIAYGQNGEAIRPDQGYPLRLIVPGFEGINNIKWVDQPYMAKMESTAYTVLWPKLEGKSRWFNFEMGPKSVITRPSGGHKLPAPGFYEITGLAWSSGGVIRRVEVSTDGGKTWKDAQLQEPVHRIAHTRFRFDWNWNGQEAVLQSRCTDERGSVQPALADIARMWGVEPVFFKDTKTRINHFNPIHPWKVNRDGSIHNGLFA
jgi:sulfane dehydrogenase subunit SoxC